MSNTLDKAEQLALLKEMLASRGILHEAQVLQLKIWPLIAMEHATSSETRFYFDEKLVVFVVKVPKKAKEPKDMKVRLEKLTESVKWLLGDEYNVEVCQGRKTIFRS